MELGIQDKEILCRGIATPMAVVEWKPVSLILVINLVFAICNSLLKVVLSEGVKHLVIVTYRQIAAALILAPLAFFFERKNETKLTPIVLGYIFTSALIGGFLSQYFFLMGLQYTTAEFSCAFSNLTPITTFILALLLRQEKANFIKDKSGRAKVLGSFLCVAGVVVMALYKGIPLNRSRKSIFDSDDNNQTIAAEPKRWIVGAVVLALAVVTWSSWFLLQARISKRYPCKYSSTAIWSMFSATQAAIACFIIDRDFDIWVLKGKLQILVVLLAGIAGSGLCYSGMSWCVEQRGPVFTSSFIPFIQVFAALFDLTFLHEQIYLGSVLGSVVVISGLYTLLWGKNKEEAEVLVTSKPADIVEENQS